MIVQSNGKEDNTKTKIKLDLENSKLNKIYNGEKYRPRELYEIEPRRNSSMCGGRDFQSIIERHTSQ